MEQPVRSYSKEQQLKNTRVKQTQKQMGDISPSVDAELKERSKGLCELCEQAWAVQRAHLTGRKQLNWKTKASDLVHVCVECHKWLDEDPKGRQARDMMAVVMNYELKKVTSWHALGKRG